MDYNRIIRELAKHVTKSAIGKLKRGKIDFNDIAIGIGLAAVKSQLKAKKPKRKNFSKATKKAALKRQGDKCNICREKTELWEYDHINGDSSNNSLENCQALCPNCHSKKTRNIKEKKKNLLQTLRWLKFVLKNLK